jgi:superfamily II DNA or RNA helicase
MKKIAHHAAIVDSWAWIPYDAQVEKKLVVKPRYIDDAEGPIKLTRRAAGWLLVPRELVSMDAKTQDQRVIGEDIAISCTVQPRNETQFQILGAAKIRLSNDESFIIQATTGFGKTYCASNLIAAVHKPTLVVVTKEDLMEQWPKELLKFTNLQPSDIGYAQQDKCEWEGKKVVIAMVHSLAKDKYPPEFVNHFGFVIFDEVHRMGAETFNRVAGMFPAKLRLGLSATVERPDGKTPVFTAHIGEVAISTGLVPMIPKVLLKETGFVLPKVHHSVQDKQGVWVQTYGPIPHTPARMMKVHKALAADDKRNAMIIDFVRQAYDAGRKIMVFSELKEGYLSHLMALLVEAGIPEGDIAYYVGGLSKKKREEAKKARIMLVTYAMVGEATDIPELDAGVFATPRANILQPLGRLLREHPGKKQPVLLDLVDSSSTLLIQFAAKRKKQYQSLKADIVNI